MLLINPDLPRVRLELGVLYFRLGSYEVARSLSRIGAEIADPAGGRAAARPRNISPRSTAKLEPVQPGRRCLLRLALPVQRQSRPRGLARAAVRPAGQPQPGRPRHGRLGRRELAAGPPSLGLRPPGQVGARDPVHRLCQPPVPGLGRQRLAARPDERAALPGLQRHLRGYHPAALRDRRLCLGQRHALLRQLGRRPRGRRAAGQRPAQRHGRCCSGARTTRTPATCRPTASIVARRCRPTPSSSTRSRSSLVLYAIGSAQRFDADIAPWQSYSL